MTVDAKFDHDSQTDLMRAAVRLYEAEMYEDAISLLNILVAHSYYGAHILLGHCISELRPDLGPEVPNAHYKIACEMGEAVGCYNLHLNLTGVDDEQAAIYLAKATELGWEDF